MRSTARTEADLIFIHDEMNVKGWRCTFSGDRWELYTPPLIIRRLKLTENHQLGTYSSLNEAYAAFRAVVFIDWASQLTREPTTIP